tara:strand:- start:740 stop:1012 length:273 start_codon:yes stop_codon:yes gene_type:complete
MEHTPEPWITSPCNCTPTCKSFFIDPVAMTDSFMPYADARRIVACVNACAGINTETLEQFCADVAAAGHDELELAAAYGKHKTLLFEREC